MYYLINDSDKEKIIIKQDEKIFIELDYENKFNNNLEFTFLNSLLYMIDKKVDNITILNFPTTLTKKLKKSFKQSYLFIDATDKDKVFFKSNLKSILKDYVSYQLYGNKIHIDIFSFIFSIFKQISVNKEILSQKKVQSPIVVNINYDIKQQFKMDQKLRKKLGIFNLFCDGSVKNLLSTSKIGGYITNQEDILITYSENVDYQIHNDVNETEMYSIYYGLSLACDMGIKEIKIFTDSLVSVEKISNYLKGNDENPKYKSVLEQIREKIKLIEDYKIEHITRRYNKYADSLTH